MLGYCGIDCNTCPAYQGTVNTQVELLEKAVAEYGPKKTSATDWICLGCTPDDQQILATYCASCDIRGCAVEKGVQNCAVCGEYESCERIKGFLEGDGKSVRQRMTWLHQRFKATSTQSSANELVESP